MIDKSARSEEIYHITRTEKSVHTSVLSEEHPVLLLSTKKSLIKSVRAIFLEMTLISKYSASFFAS